MGVTVDMRGAEALIRTLLAGGVDTCFANPGTSEMHFVASLDDVPEMRAILTLFEGVATGAADGYERMADRPASTLLHLGPGQGNGLANLHNARRAGTGMVNIVGDHAVDHRQYDAPLASDIASVSETVSSLVLAPETPNALAAAAAEAVAEASGPRAGIATLIAAADTCWLDADGPAEVREPKAFEALDADRITDVAKVLTGGGNVGLLFGGRSIADEGALRSAARIRAAGVNVLEICFPRRIRRGAGLPVFDRINYLPEFAEAQLAGLDDLVLADAVPPATFFGYPDRSGSLVPVGCDLHELCTGDHDTAGALAAIADEIGAPTEIETVDAGVPDRPNGDIDIQTLAAAVASTLPEHAIVADEGTTSGLFVQPFTAGCAPHDWLNLTGGSIGDGMPMATGAAVACPDRPVINLQADGSAMYTIQSLWTQARENLDVTTVLFNNSSYAILNMELDRVGASADGSAAKAMLDLSRPDLDFVKLAEGMGVPAVRVTTAEDLSDHLERCIAEPGSHLIEAIVPSAI